MSRPGTDAKTDCRAIPTLIRSGFAAWSRPLALLLVAAVGLPAVANPASLRPASAEPAAGSVDEAKQRDLRLAAAWTLAQREGLLKDRSWSAFKLGWRRKVLAEAYLKAMPGHPALTEAQAKAIYLNQGEERRVWHLLRPDQASAQALLLRIRAGEDAGALAAEHSTDGSAKENRGDLGWMRKEQVVAPFGEAVFGQPSGTLLGPFQTEFGWHLAKSLEARRPDEAGWAKDGAAFTANLAKEQQSLKRTLALKSLRTRFPLEKDMAVLGLDRATLLAPGDDKRIAGRIAGRTLSLADLKAHMQTTLGASAGTHSLGADTKAGMLEALADGVRLEAAAEAMGLQRTPPVVAALRNGEREEALARVSHRLLARQKVEDQDLAAHLQSHPDRFLGAGDLRLQQLACSSQASAEEARREADAGMRWSELCRRFADHEATGSWDLGWVEVSKLKGALDPTALEQILKAPQDQAIGPLPGPDGYMLFKILARRPGPPMALAECREAVRVDFLKAHGVDLVAAHLDQLAARSRTPSPRRKGSPKSSERKDP